MAEQNTAIVFDDPETAKAFEATSDKDVTIHIAGKYSGKLSGVPAEVAAGMLKRNSNLIKEKGIKPTTTAGNTAGAGKDK